MHVAAWYRGTPGPENFTKFHSMNKYPLARPLVPNFVTLRQEVWDMRCRKFVLLEKWTKSSSKYLKIYDAPMPLVVPNFHRALPNDIRDKKRYKFLCPSVFYRPSLGNDVQQDPDYQCAKFRPLLTTRLQDICCRTSLISLKAWPRDVTDKNTKRSISAYHVETIREWPCRCRTAYNSVRGSDAKAAHLFACLYFVHKINHINGLDENQQCNRHV